MLAKIGTGELMLVLAIAVIIVGPAKLPGLGKTIGKTFGEFKKFSKEIKEDVTLDLDKKTNKD